MKQNENPKRSGHLDYLLTAYVFDSISLAGRNEVEAHLAECAECRSQLELLRQTLGLAEQALDGGGTEYVFEERRRARVLEAARRRGTLPRVQWGWKLSMVAALFMVTALVALLNSAAHKPAPIASAPAAASKAYAEAEEVYHRTDYDTDGVLEYSGKGNGKKQDAFAVEKSKDVEILGKVQKREAQLQQKGEALPMTPVAENTTEAQSPAAAPDSGRRSFAFGAGQNPAIKEEAQEGLSDREKEINAPAVAAALPTPPPPPGAMRGGSLDNGLTAVKPEPKSESKSESKSVAAGGASLATDELRVELKPSAEFAVKIPAPSDAPVYAVPAENAKLAPSFTPANTYQYAISGVTAENKTANSDPVWMKNHPRHVEMPPASTPATPPQNGNWKADGQITIDSRGGAKKNPAPEKPSAPAADAKLKFNEARDRELQDLTKLSSAAEEKNEYGFEFGRRKELAIAAKDEAIRKQEEIIKLEREFTERLQEAKDQLANQSEEMALRNSRMTARNSEVVAKLGKEIGDLEKKMSSLDGKMTVVPSGGAVGGDANGKPVATQPHIEDAGVEFQNLDPNALVGDFGDVRRLGAPTGPVQLRETADVIIPKDILEKAELGDHFETISPDRPDTNSFFGSRDKKGDASQALNYGLAFDDAQKGPGIVPKVVEKEVESKYGPNSRGRTRDKVIIRQSEQTPPGNTETERRVAGRYITPDAPPKVVNGTVAVIDEALESTEGLPSSGNSKAGYLFGEVSGGGGIIERRLEELTDVGGEPNPSTVGGAFGMRGKSKSATNVNAADNLGKELDQVVQDANGQLHWKESAGRNGDVDEHSVAPPTRLSARNRTPGNAAVDLDTFEYLLRGYRHLRTENPKLTWNEFLRRPASVPAVARTDDGLDEDAYIEKYGTRPFVDCARDHLSTFGLDVDTASYTLARSRLNQNELPDPESVRVEEFLNYFKQPYTVAGQDAFGVFAEAAPSPFDSAQRLSMPGQVTSGTLKALSAPAELLKIGIKSRDARADERKPAMLTFVIDTSGSMTKQDRLDLVRAALKSLVEKLNAEDAISIIGFNDQAELCLPRTQARQKQRILDAIDALTSKGGTNVEAGLTMAYRLADESYSPDAVNRVILCSDGVANVGAKGPDEILKLVKVFAGRGIDLCTVGFGMGKYNDQMMVKLADSGNGSCHFVDSRAEAEKIFSEQLPPHLSVLARDAKAQVEFNPDVVERYRLLGYEKRKIADKDFRNDKIDAGEVAHSTLITVLYEIQRKPSSHGALGKVFLRWKDAGYRHQPVVERNYPLSEGIVAADLQHASPQLRFLACVGRFAELLRGSKWAQDGSYGAVIAQLDQLPGDFRQREDWKEMRDLVARAQQLSVKKWAAELGR